MYVYYIYINQELTILPFCNISFYQWRNIFFLLAYVRTNLIMLQISDFSFGKSNSINLIV